jgi:hypothetical protein
MTKNLPKKIWNQKKKYRPLNSYERKSSQQYNVDLIFFNHFKKADST